MRCVMLEGMAMERRSIVVTIRLDDSKLCIRCEDLERWHTSGYSERGEKILDQVN